MLIGSPLRSGTGVAGSITAMRDPGKPQSPAPDAMAHRRGMT